MAFRIKDLLINVASAERKLRWGDCFMTLWGDCSWRIFSANCTGNPTIRPPTHLTICGTTWWGAAGPGPVGPGDPVEWVEQLAILKAELKAALEEVEREEAALEQAMKPSTEGEIEELEAKLREGLAELERLKAELKRK
jgi:hypothetical protein